MSGTCHNRSTFESGVFINNVALGTSPTAANGAVMQKCPHGAFLGGSAEPREQPG